MFIHCENISAVYADERGGRGTFAVVQTAEHEYQVYEDSYHHGEYATLEDAIERAEQLADAFDQRKIGM